MSILKIAKFIHLLTNTTIIYLCNEISLQYKLFHVNISRYIVLSTDCLCLLMNLHKIRNKQKKG